MKHKNENTVCSTIADCELMNLLRIREIRERIREGAYDVDGSTIAASLLRSHLSFGTLVSAVG
jgi:anti-sigma28 factor (negative regulator of flagellin synthesis)